MIKNLINQTITDVRVDFEDEHQYSKRILLRLSTHDGYFDFIHWQDCCECVWLEDGLEDLQSMIGQKVLNAYETSQHQDQDEDEDRYDSATWTFYNISTMYKEASLRFIGESNGYYSESVDIDYHPYDEEIIEEDDDYEDFE